MEDKNEISYYYDLEYKKSGERDGWWHEINPYSDEPNAKDRYGEKLHLTKAAALDRILRFKKYLLENDTKTEIRIFNCTETITTKKEVVE